MFVVIARIKAREGEGDELEDVFKELVEWVTENEADTLTYTCSRSTSDRDQFTFFERYTSQKAFESHAGSEKFAELVGQIQGRLAGPIEIETYDEIAGKL